MQKKLQFWKLFGLFVLSIGTAQTTFAQKKKAVAPVVPTTSTLAQDPILKEQSFRLELRMLCRGSIKVFRR